MVFYTPYKAVFDRVKADLVAVTTINQVVLGEQYKISDLPLAIINPASTEIEPGDFDGQLICNIAFEVLILIRETEPEDWFVNIVSVMCAALDAILADPTLNNTVNRVWPTLFEPGEIKLTNRLYYGGVVGFTASMFYSP